MKSPSQMDNYAVSTTYIISVKPKWANAFFAASNPKSIELRKGNFGSSLKPGDNLVIYSTLPEGKAIGTVKIADRYEWDISTLWLKAEQISHVSYSEFRKYYEGHHFGVGVWVSEPEKWENPIALAELRQILGDHWQPPQQIAKINLELLKQSNE